MNKVITDISGTLVPLDFSQTCIAFFRSQGTMYLDTSPTPQASEIAAEIRSQQGLGNSREVIEFVANEFAQQSIIQPAYLALASHVLDHGYLCGALKAPLFGDVVPAFNRWKNNNKSIYSFSQGTAHEQEIMFQTSEQGDIRSYLDGYFGTDTIGVKNLPSSFLRISEEVKAAPHELVFLSDRLHELDAASSAGLQAILVKRPGNKPIAMHSYREVTSFDNLYF